MSNKIFALVGPYASGKSSLITRLMDLGVHYIPVYSTSDAMRLKKDKRMVNFVSKSAFEQADWIVKVAYKGDYYGIKKKDMLAIATALFASFWPTIYLSNASTICLGVCSFNAFILLP